MRKMLILQGVPGSGKSRFCNENNLCDFVVSRDVVRSMLTPTLPSDLGSVHWNTMSNESFITKVIDRSLSNRMQVGDTIIVDNTNTKVQEIRDFAEKARSNNYQVAVLRFDIPLDVAISQDKVREFRVGEDVIRKFYERQKSMSDKVILEHVDNVFYEESDAMNWLRDSGGLVATLSMNDNFILVGDVHSDSYGLGRLVERYDTPDVTWVFCGDLFDRGSDPAGVWNIIHNLNGNAVFVRGNHEQNIKTIIDDPDTCRFRATQETVRALLHAGIPQDDVENFVDKTVIMATFVDENDNVVFLATHGGVDNATYSHVRHGDIYRVSERVCIYGVSRSWESMNGRSTYTELATLNLAPHQAFGHRGNDIDELLKNDVFNLEHGAPVKNIGYVIKNAEGNLIMASQDCQEEGTKMNIFDDMKKHPYVKVVDIHDPHITTPVQSALFTREAFRKGVWDDITCKARGYFVHEQTGDVLVRGFDKMFDITEDDIVRLERELSGDDNHSPVLFKRKEAGFLMLVSVIDDNIVTWTKGGWTEFAKAGRDLLEATVDMELLKETLTTYKVTMAVEVILVNDPHPVFKNSSEIVVLEFIRNSVEFQTVNVSQSLVADIGLRVAPVITGVTKVENLRETLNRIRHMRGVEGVVAYHPNVGRFKVKTIEYLLIKAMRNRLRSVLTGKSEDFKSGVIPSVAHLLPDARFENLWEWMHVTRAFTNIDSYRVTGILGSEEVDYARLVRDIEDETGKTIAEAVCSYRKV